MNATYDNAASSDQFAFTGVVDYQLEANTIGLAIGEGALGARVPPPYRSLLRFWLRHCYIRFTPTGWV